MVVRLGDGTRGCLCSCASISRTSCSYREIVPAVQRDCTRGTVPSVPTVAPQYIAGVVLAAPSGLERGRGERGSCLT
eukprot:1012696-Rhodomonas_salina.4